MKTILLTMWSLLCLVACGQKTTDLTPGTTTATADLFRFVDVSDTAMAGTGTNKSITWANLVAEMMEDITASATYQPLDADLTIYAGITPSANVQSLLGAANYAGMRSLLNLETGTDLQGYDDALTDLAAVNASADALSLLGAANYAGMRTLLDLNPTSGIPDLAADIVGLSDYTTGFLIDSAAWALELEDDLEAALEFQPVDADLTALAALAGTDNIYYRSGANTWSSVTVGSGLTFAAGALSATGGGFDATALDAVTWSDGTNASNIWTFDVSGTDPTMTFGSGVITLGADLAMGGNDITGIGTMAVTTLDATALEVGSVAVTSTAAELNILDGVTSTADELNYSDGVTSNIQTQLDTKAPAVMFIEQHATSHTLSASECYGSTYYITAAGVTLTLPAAVDGMSLTVICTTANVGVVDSNAGDLIILDGTALDDGDSIDSPGVAGDIVVLTYYDATGWYAASNSWVDGGAS